MNLRHNDPGLQLLMWRSDERALLARAEIRRQMGPRTTEMSWHCAAMRRSVEAILMRCLHWLIGNRDDARTVNFTGRAEPTA